MGTSLAPYGGILAGHVHAFYTMNVAGAPPLVVNGEGGDLLDSGVAKIMSSIGTLRVVGTPFDSGHFGSRLHQRPPQPALRRTVRRYLVTHRPPYTNVNLRAAMGTSLAPYGGILAGHVHAFYTMNVAGAPPLVVNGEGGDCSTAAWPRS